MGRGDAAASTSKGTPRIRNKITHKTRLRLVHGDVVDADRAFGDDDASDGKALATGVDAEDANEYHLLAVLAASQQQSSSSSTAFCQQQPLSSSSRAPNNSNKANLAPPTIPAQPALYIPTPDATGKVANYADHYPDIQWEPSTLLTKASETLEESQSDVLAGGYAYVMDERDDDWLERYNKDANGEGSSSVAGTPRGARSAKARGKEPESVPPPPISEDDFELVMGLYERFTEQESPYLHMSPSDIPSLSDYEALFSAPLPPHFFPSFIVPEIVPPPARLSRYARSVYPHWRERKIERGGRRIIPQLNYDESNDSDPYVCFRRREVKPLRKTRRQDTTSLDRLLKLQEELKKVLSMSKAVLEREQVKVVVAKEMRGVTEKRVRLVECRKKAGALVLPINDDELFVDRSAVKRRDKADGTSNTIRLRPPRASYEGNAGPGYGPVLGLATSAADLHQNALAKITELQHRVEREVTKRKDPQWEDVTENAFQPLSTPLSLKHFRTISVTAGESPAADKPLPFTAGSRNGRSTVAMRMRVGRGGRMMMDRRMPTSRHPLDVPPLSTLPSETGQSYLSKPSVYSSESRPMSENADAELRERAWRIEEKWRYDTDAGLAVGGAGLGDAVGESEDTRLIVDDYEHNSFMVRKSLLMEEDFSSLLRTDDGHLTRVLETRHARREEEQIRAQKAIQLAAEVRREMAARAPPPPPATPTVVPPSAQVAISVNGSPAAANGAMVAQIKKAQQVRQGMQQPQQQRPHPLAMSSTASQQSQASPTSASAASSGPSPNLANGLPVAKPTPPPSFPSTHLQPPRPSPSPNMHENGMPSSPEVRPKSQPNGVPMSISQPGMANSTGYLNSSGTNGMMTIPNFPNGFNASTPTTMQMQMRAGQMLMNGGGSVAAGGMNVNMMNGLTPQQAMSLKTAFAQQQAQQQQQAQMPTFPNMTNAAPAPSPQSVQNINLAMGNGNIPLKLPVQRAMQWATANTKDGTPQQQQPQQQQPQQLSSSPTPRLARGSPHGQSGRASPGNMNGILPHHTTSPSPRITHAPSPLVSHQQTVGGPGQGHLNGY